MINTNNLFKCPSQLWSCVVVHIEMSFYFIGCVSNFECYTFHTFLSSYKLMHHGNIDLYLSGVIVSIVTSVAIKRRFHAMFRKLIIFPIVNHLWCTCTNSWDLFLKWNYVQLYAKVSISFTWGKHLHDRIVSQRGEVWDNKTSFTTPLFIEVPVPNQEWHTNTWRAQNRYP
jgi:hypothetical protein